jgi:hypothetical protein
MNTNKLDSFKACLGLVCLLLVSCSDKPDPAYELSRDCYNHYKAKSYDVALSICEKAANHDDVYAMWYLATIHYYGVSQQEQNKEKAFSWYSRAAEAGLVKAQRFVGESYLYADGVDENFELAYKWLNKAAEQQDALSEFALGNMYLEGSGRKQDISLAIAWFKRAALQKHTMAINNLAWIYATSSNVSYRNPNQALFWAEQLPASLDNTEIPVAENKDRLLYFDTLAAAHALSNNFDKAILFQERAIKMLSEDIEPDELKGYQERLDFYKQNKPWVDESI